MQVLRHAERRPVPWKNGLGITFDVARRDDETSVLWRVSIAVCDSACPFSRFDGLDRQLLVIDGDPMRLVIDGTPVIVEAGSGPISFPGEAVVACTPLGRPTFDLNLMTRRDAVVGTLSAPGSATVCTGEGLLIVVGDSAEIAGHHLSKFDALIIDEGEVVTFPLETAHKVATIRLVSHTPSVHEMR